MTLRPLALAIVVACDAESGGLTVLARASAGISDAYWRRVSSNEGTEPP